MAFVVYFCILSCYFFCLVWSYQHRSWIGGLLCLAFGIRAILALVFLSELQAHFVLDRSGFETDAWNLAKAWSSSLPTNSELYFSFGEINLYKMLLASVFFLFGNERLLGMLLNSLFATLTIYIIYRIAEKYFTTTLDLKNQDFKVKFLAATLVTFYPSFIIWSATNIRDPLYFLSYAVFFYFLFGIFSPRSRFSLAQKALGLVPIFLSVAVILSLRLYIGFLFLGSITLGIAFYFLILKIGFKRLIQICFVLFLISSWALHSMFSEIVLQALNNLAQTRESFANMGYEDFATSSFALGYEFSTILDLIIFIPIALSHYFLGPFFWNISSPMQAFSQIEVFAIYLLLYPTYRGIQKAYKFALFETTLLITFCLLMAIAQSLIISNLGTLFRHRTLAFIFLSLFTAIGLLDIYNRHLAKKKLGFK